MSLQPEHYETTKDNLFSANQIMPIVTDKLTIKGGQNLKRGAIVDASGTLVVTGGTPYAVLAEGADTTAGDKDCAVYLTGEFSETALSVANGAEVASLKGALRGLGIFVKKNF